MTKLEECARAIYDAGNTLTMPGISNYAATVYARAVLTALLKPSEGMVNAGYNWGRNAPDSGVEETWFAMIDFVLNEKE